MEIKLFMYYFKLVCIFLIAITLGSCNNNPKCQDSDKGLLKENLFCQDSIFYNLQQALGNKECVKDLRINQYIAEDSLFQIEKLVNLNSILFDHFNPVLDLNSIVRIQTLSELHVAHTSGLILPTTFDTISNINEIHMIFCDLSEVPKFICSISNLKVLNLTGNRIESLPKCLCEMDSLKLLVLNTFGNYNDLLETDVKNIAECNQSIQIKNFPIN